jgi:hypothetical protein
LVFAPNCAKLRWIIRWVLKKGGLTTDFTDKHGFRVPIRVLFAPGGAEIPAVYAGLCTLVHPCAPKKARRLELFCGPNQIYDVDNQWHATGRLEVLGNPAGTEALIRFS